MSTIQEVSPEQLAKVFHHYWEALGRNCHGRDSAGHGMQEKASWEQTPEDERKLMVTAARLALLELTTTPASSKQTREYYAKPGEAEWGC